MNDIDKRCELMNYAYHSNNAIAKDYRYVLNTASQQTLDTVYSLFTTLVKPYFIPGPVNPHTGKHVYDAELRTIFNNVRDHFVSIVTQYAMHDNVINLTEQDEIIMAMLGCRKLVEDNSKAMSIYRNIVEAIKQIKGRGFDNRFKIASYKRLYSINEMQEPIKTFEAFDGFHTIVINNDYVLSCSTDEEFNYLKNAIDFAYERHLVHGHVVNVSTL